MPVKRLSITLISLFALCVMVLSSCQKDPEVLAVSKPKTDTLITTPGRNILASTGTLTIKFRDSTYTFNAANDSIAFIQVNTNNKEKYFGITAINKAHNLSFGISSPGATLSTVKANVAGSQLLLKSIDESYLQYSLSGLNSDKAFSNFNVIQYNTGKVLAKGTFTVFLLPENLLIPGPYKAEGSFDLRLN